MKRDATEYVALCDTCQRVKIEHQRHARLYNLLRFQNGIRMDFIVGLPRT
jgi:hypothetical protein